jgi:hypothetical protein
MPLRPHTAVAVDVHACGVARAFTDDESSALQDGRKKSKLREGLELGRGLHLLRGCEKSLAAKTM